MEIVITNVIKNDAGRNKITQGSNANKNACTFTSVCKSDNINSNI